MKRDMNLLRKLILELEDALPERVPNLNIEGYIAVGEKLGSASFEVIAGALNHLERQLSPTLACNALSSRNFFEPTWDTIRIVEDLTA